MDYTKHFSLKETPQNQPIPRKDMVKNSSGGFTFQIDKWARLDRFLILGAEGGSYYTLERKLVEDNAKSVIECIKENGPKVIQRIAFISDSGSAFKNDPAIFALTLAITYGDLQTKKLGYDIIPTVCRIGTHLFTFCNAIQQLRGWSGGLRRAIANYYQSKSVDNLVYDLLKYQSRNGFSHRDVLRLAHVKPNTEQQKHILGYAVGKDGEEFIHSHKIIEAVHSLKTETDYKKAIPLILDLRLPREVIPTHFLNYREVWEALLQNMPLNAMLRNLGKMTSVGLLRRGVFCENEKLVVSRLLDQDILKRSRIHPISILLALKVYQQGHGVKGDLRWETNKKIMDALNDSFYLSFQNLQPTNKRYLLALDVSGSMGSTVANTPLTSYEIISAFALVTARIEPNYEIMAFSKGFINLNISARDSLSDVLTKVTQLPFDNTDCSLPFLYALKNKMNVDVFGVYTDNETNTGSIHPIQALNKYRKQINPIAKSYVMSTEASEFTIADPNDSGMLDIVGFDANSPSVIQWFVRG